MNRKNRHVSWNKWTVFRQLKMNLTQSKILNNPIILYSGIRTGYRPKFNLNEFIGLMGKRRSEQINYPTPTQSYNNINMIPTHNYTITNEMTSAAKKIIKNIKIYQYNKLLSRKIYNIHLIYLCFINSDINNYVFELNPSFSLTVPSSPTILPPSPDFFPPSPPNKKTLKKTKSSSIHPLLNTYNDLNNDYSGVSMDDNTFYNMGGFGFEDPQYLQNDSKYNLKKRTNGKNHSKNSIPSAPDTIQIVDERGMLAFSTKKISYKEVYTELHQMYHSHNEYFSSAMDILASYVKGQKLIYMEAESHCQNNLNFLMFPSIFASACASVLATIFENYVWGGHIISAINAAISFLLSIISYLKLDAKSEAHKISAHQYDKLQSICEFSSGNLLLFTDMKPFETQGQESEFFKEIQKKINTLEAKIKEIKETNQFIVPKRIRHRYKIAYNINVFSVIKKINGLKRHYVSFIRDRINQIKMYKQQHNQEILSGRNKNSPEVIKIKQLIDQEYYEKHYGFEKYQLLKSSFGIIDQLLADEMEYAEKVRRRWFCSWCCCYARLPRPELKNTLTFLITDPFSSLDKRSKINYQNYIKKMYQKYDMSGNIFSVPENKKPSKIIPNRVSGCFKLKNRELEIKKLFEEMIEDDSKNADSYEQYRDYSCCYKTKCLLIIFIFILIGATVGIILSIQL